MLHSLNISLLRTADHIKHSMLFLITGEVVQDISKIDETITLYYFLSVIKGESDITLGIFSAIYPNDASDSF